jgi:RING finger protein 113A
MHELKNCFFYEIIHRKNILIKQDLNNYSLNIIRSEAIFFENKMSQATESLFIKKKRNVNLRKIEQDENEIDTKQKRSRFSSTSSNESEENSDTDVRENLDEIRRKADRKKQTFLQSTKNLKTRPQDSDDENESSKKVFTTTFKADKQSKRTGPQDMGATAAYELDTDFTKDTQAVFERAKKINDELKQKESDDKIYRGMNNYQQFIEKKDSVLGNAASGMARNKGPIRAPTNLRATVLWDYKPDICKDYKETGYCGFGDSCIFMHDRSDYKHGWQLEQEWEKEQGGRLNKNFFKSKKKKKNQSDEEKESGDDDDPNKYVIQGVHSDDDDDLPFKCIICRESFVKPVVTKCKHYFCEKCFINHNKKDTRCFACKKQTLGIFFEAKDIIKKIKEVAAAGEATGSKTEGYNDDSSSD